MSNSTQPSLEKIVSLCKRRGFVFQTSEIYGGLANSYDYGPLGAALKKNIQDLWWKEFVQKRADIFGLDSQILLHPETWVASGHVSSFNDPLVEDLVSHKRYRADHLIEEWQIKNRQSDQPHVHADMPIEDMSVEDMANIIKEHQIKSPEGNDISEPKMFNLLFETSIGSVEDSKSTVYLRGETAQGLFTNFKQVLDSTRAKLPFGLANIGTSFRNEITTGQFIFRTIEFAQAEIEYFFDPEKSNWQELFKEWQDKMWSFVTEKMGINQEQLRWRQHSETERSFYSLDTYDLEYNYPFGWKELWGIAYRTDYDLKVHHEKSGESMTYRDPETNKEFIPHVIEPAAGIARLFLMALVDAYWEDEARNRVVLKLKPSIAPYLAAVFPLLKNKPELVEKARNVFESLSDEFSIAWDERGNIGKRYLYQDEIGTPYGITIDFQTLEDETVTLRDRDTTNQVRVKISDLPEYLRKSINN